MIDIGTTLPWNTFFFQYMRSRTQLAQEYFEPLRGLAIRPLVRAQSEPSAPKARKFLGNLDLSTQKPPLLGRRFQQGGLLTRNTTDNMTL